MQIHVRSSQNTKLPDIKASQNTKITGFPILSKHLTTGYPIYSPKSNSRHVLSDQAPTRRIFYPVKYIDSRSLNRYMIQSYISDPVCISTHCLADPAKLQLQIRDV